MILYHGGTDIVEKPAIISRSAGRDFGMGFYCTDIRSQAENWAKRQGRIRKQTAVLNVYEFDIDYAHNKLNLKMFEDYSREWLKLVINCRKDLQYIHGFDLVYGKIANDDVGETVQAVLDGLMPFDFALQKLAFMPSNNQYCFCTEKSLAYIDFHESIKLGLVMPHGTIRATTLKTIIPLIMERFNCGENAALKMFYESHTGKCYADDNTGLYGQSAAYVFSLFCEEKAEAIEETPIP